MLDFSDLNSKIFPWFQYICILFLLSILFFNASFWKCLEHATPRYAALAYRLLSANDTDT